MQTDILAHLRHAPWLTRDRVMAWATVLLVLETLFVCFIAAWQNGLFFAAERQHSADYVSFHAAGQLVLAGHPALAYDQAAHLAAQHATTGVVGDASYQYFFYPPVFLLLCAPLALLPYGWSLGLFLAATLGLFLFAMHRLLRPTGMLQGWGWLIPVLSFPPMIWNIGLGQNAFLTAALFAGFTLMLDRRPASAGAMLGLMCYKPHYGLLAPVALASGQRWKAFFSAAAVVAGLVGLSVALFGVETWQAYLAAASGSSKVYESGRIDLAGMITLFGAARLIGVPPQAAWALQAVAAVLMAGLVALVWRRNDQPNARSTTLLVATLLAVPLSLVYDQLLLLVAMAWLLRDVRQTGFLPWERLLLVAIWPLSLMTWIIGSAWHIPLAPLTHLTVLALGLRRLYASRAVSLAYREA